MYKIIDVVKTENICIICKKHSCSKEIPASERRTHIYHPDWGTLCKPCLDSLPQKCPCSYELHKALFLDNTLNLRISGYICNDCRTFVLLKIHDKFINGSKGIILENVYNDELLEAAIQKRLDEEENHE